jgi:hypothetical protein
MDGRVKKCLRRLPAGFGAVLLLAAAVASAAADRWMLISRHGDCAEIKAVERKVPDLGAVRDPDSFVKLMRERGHTVFAKEQAAAAGPMVDVRIPDKALSLIFVTAEMCRTAK